MHSKCTISHEFLEMLFYRIRTPPFWKCDIVQWREGPAAPRIQRACSSCWSPWVLVNTCLSYFLRLVTSSTWCLFILAQTDQQLPELGLASALSATTNTLAAEIDELRYPLPAGATGGCVLPAAQELLGLLARLGDGLVLLVVVVLVKVVDGLLGGLDGFCLAVR